MSHFVVVQDSISTPDFEKWRVSPNDKNLLFNFKDIVKSEEDAIALVVKCYGKDMTGIRRLISHTILEANWIIIEACFSTEEGRLCALKDGITIAGDVKIIPQTTSTKVVKYTCLTLAGMILFPTHDQIKNSLIQWSKLVIDSASYSALLCKNKPLSITIDDNSIIWMGVDASGLYRGKGGVILQGYDERFTIGRAIARTQYNFLLAPNYPGISVSVKCGYMYCAKCHILNDHETADCTVANCGKGSDNSVCPAEQQTKLTEPSQEVKEQDNSCAKKINEKRENAQNQEKSSLEAKDTSAQNESEKDDTQSTDSFTFID